MYSSVEQDYCNDSFVLNLAWQFTPCKSGPQKSMLFELPAFHALHSIVTETVSDNCLVTMTAFTSNLWNVGVSSGVSEKMLICFD